jgi:hypothetical protein
MACRRIIARPFSARCTRAMLQVERPRDMPRMTAPRCLVQKPAGISMRRGCSSPW